MADLTPNHPAVRAANMGVQEWLAGDGPFDDDPVRLAHEMTAVCITAALPHLESATEENLARLRDTPAGRALIAEGRGWTPATERDRRALAILNDPTVPAGTRHVLATGIRLLHKLERLNER